MSSTLEAASASIGHFLLFDHEAWVSRYMRYFNAGCCKQIHDVTLMISSWTKDCPHSFLVELILFIGHSENSIRSWAAMSHHSKINTAIPYLTSIPVEEGKRPAKPTESYEKKQSRFVLPQILFFVLVASTWRWRNWGRVPGRRG